jgi:DNA-binding NarL/FixJ family response regulator
MRSPVSVEKPMNATPDPRAAPSSILVVEDFRSLRASVVHWLECRFPGCVIHGVESGEEALKHASAFRTHIVIMDINLPGINGIEATRRIKAQAPETAVVMLTTHDTPYHRLAAASAGAVGYITKYEMEAQLESTIEDLLDSRARGLS